MKHLPLFLILTLLLAGCAGSGPDSRTDTVSAEDNSVDQRSPSPTARSEPAEGSASQPANGAKTADSPVGVAPSANDGTLPTPVTVKSGVVTLDPANTKIEFIGTHVGARPDPRTGGFEKFTGEIHVDPPAGAPKSITVEIETDSLWTQISKLTNHLKSVDFLEVREYPTATFQSTNVTAADAASGEYVVTGHLTLHGVTKQISFPAHVSLSNDGFVLRSSFTLNRMDFDVAYDPGRVETEVALKVVVGEPTRPQRAQGGFGGRGGGFDPAQFFNRSDVNGDGKLTGDEISERMRENMDATDTDGDGAISLEEFQERMRSFGGGRRGGRGRGDGGGRGR